MEDIIDKIMTMLVHGLISFIIPGCRRSDSTGKRRCSDGSREEDRAATLIYVQTVVCSRIRSHVLNGWNRL